MVGQVVEQIEVKRGILRSAGQQVLGGGASKEMGGELFCAFMRSYDCLSKKKVRIYFVQNSQDPGSPIRLAGHHYGFGANG